MGKYKKLKKEVAELRQIINQLHPENLEVQFEQVNELPEKWCVEDNEVVSEWASKKHGCGNWPKPSEYYHSRKNGGYDFLKQVEKGYTEITFDTFKRLVLKEDEKPVELEVGKWYQLKEFPTCLGNYGGAAINNYGFTEYGEWTNGLNMSTPEKWQPATEEEVSAALIKEAERRGYKQGISFIRLGINDTDYKYSNASEGRFKWYSGGVTVPGIGSDILMLDGNAIFSNGKWATIIEPKEQPIDWSVQGQLVKSDYVVVLTNGEHRANNDMFSGTVVKHLKGHFFKGHYSTSWAKSCFTLCTEPITLQN